MLLVLAAVVSTAATGVASPADTMKPENLGPAVNSMFEDILPVISPDGRTLYFCRGNSPENIGGGRQDIWMSTMGSDGKWSVAVNVGPPLNNRENNHVFSITPDGNLMLLGDAYSDARDRSRALAYSTRAETGWSKPQRLRIKDWYTDNMYREFSLSNDGKTLIISAERRDGRGGKDLYVSFRESDSVWSEPVNMGPAVNTIGHEATPFIASDNTSLYFASDGRGGYGLYDIFVTRRQDSTWTNWSEPENLGSTINTSEPDLYYTVPARGDYAYFVSYKNTYGAADIFRVRLPEKVRPRPVVLVYGRVLNKKTNDPVAADIAYEDLATGREMGIARSAPTTGDYKIILPAGSNYGFRASAPKFMSINDNIDLTNLKEYSEIRRDLYLVPIEPGQALPLNNIFFDFAKATLRKESFPELDRITQMLLDNPTMVVEIGGHTDDRGAEDLNQKLSEARSKAVVDYCSKKGPIKRERFVPVGYGESKPKATNETDEGRQINRRVEVVILQP
jgi:OmpA-OmpF porin, OOP family